MILNVLLKYQRIWCIVKLNEDADGFIQISNLSSSYVKIREKLPSDTVTAKYINSKRKKVDWAVNEENKKKSAEVVEETARYKIAKAEAVIE